MASILKTFRVGATTIEKLNTFSEKLKGGRLEKWASYWKGLYADYREVGKDVVADMKSKPKKAVAIATGLSTLVLAYSTNPKERTLRHEFLVNRNRIALVHEDLRNRTSEEHLRFLSCCYNEGLLRVQDCLFFSLLWIADYDRAVTLYASQCTYLKPRYFTFHERVVDVGAFGRWFVLAREMTDYDVNEEEWTLH